ncbi:MAG: carboxypeptidase-like regulatory domain-containing protein, partial [Candidatus Poribacteria bacterium]
HKIVVFTDKKGYYRLDGLSTGSFKVGFFNAGGEKLGVKDASVKKGKITRLDFVVSDQPNEEFIIADMQIEDVEIQFLKSLPLQINLAVKGILGDGCTTLNEITQKRDGNTVYVKITTKRPKGVACIEIAKFITENVKLDGGFPQGHYKIIVNNVVKELDIDGGNEGVGFLKGKVTIGPLCPVEPCNLPPGQVAKIYKSRKAIVYDQGTKKKVIEADLDEKGEFSFSLNSGNYIVDISDAEGNPIPLDEPRIRMGNATPKEIKIKSGQTTFIEFDIDTGIR